VLGAPRERGVLDRLARRAARAGPGPLGLDL